MFRRNRIGRGWLLLSLAAFLLLLLAAAQGYVSWQAQFTFINAAKHSVRASALEALGLDTGAVIFALLGLALARMGRSATIERVLNVTCALGSMTMNLLSAQLGSPRSVAVYILPAILYAACSDRLIATAGRASGVADTSTWRWVGRAFMYSLRVPLAPWTTVRGMRRLVLQLTPLPEPSPKRALTAAPVSVPAPETTFSGSTTGRMYPKTNPVTEAPKRTVSRPSKKAPAPAVRKPIEEVLAAAEREFVPELAAGKAPGIRDIRDRLQVGQDRAGTVREHLTNLMSEHDQAVRDVVTPPVTVEATVLPAKPYDPDATESFSAIGHPSPGQHTALSYQQLPVTPGGR